MANVDREFDDLLIEQTELQMQFAGALEQLDYLSDDFSEEAQQQWGPALHEVAELREKIWVVTQAIEKYQSDL